MIFFDGAEDGFMQGAKTVGSGMITMASDVNLNAYPRVTWHCWLGGDFESAPRRNGTPLGCHLFEMASCWIMPCRGGISLGSSRRDVISGGSKLCSVSSIHASRR